MNSLIKTSLKRTVTVCVLVIVLMAFGVLATLDMSTNLLPNIKLPMMGISVVYPGAGAQSVEDDVTAKVEAALQTVPGITQLKTTSYDNVSVAVLTFDYGTDLDEKIAAIEDAFGSVTFPDGCQSPDYIKIDMNGTATATIAIYAAASDDAALQQLFDDADALSAKLSGIEGVGSVSALGTPQRQITITALQGLDMTALLAVQALQNENLNIPLGTIMQDGTTVSIRNATDAAGLLDVMRLPVELPLGSETFRKLDSAKSLLVAVENCTLQQLESLADMMIRLRTLVSQDANVTDEDARSQLLVTLHALDEWHYFESMGGLPQNIDELLTTQVVHILRLPNFYRHHLGELGNSAETASPDCIVGKLVAVKKAHVNDEGEPIYANGQKVALNEQGRRVGNIGDKTYLVDNYGRLTDDKGNLVGADGTPLQLSDEQIAANYYTYGEYTVFSDDETLDLCNALGLGESLGIDLTQDLVRLVRTCDFGGRTVNGVTAYPESLLVPLACIGRVEEQDSRIAYAQYNGLAAVTIEVYAVSDANTTDVVDNVKQVLDQTQTDSETVLLDDKAEFITDSISNVLVSIVIGGVLAVLVIYLFVRKIGSSLVVSITMPLSVLVALIGLWAMGISLNLVSLGGLAVGIGMLVDNSIVVLESITKRRDQGESVYDACLNGTKEVAGSLFASTLTNVCVFFPILFARGLTREIFYDLVWAVLFSIVMSLIVAVTVIPSLYHLIYRKGPRLRYKKNADGTYTQAGSYEDAEPRGRTSAITSDVTQPTEQAQPAEEPQPQAATAGTGKRRKRRSGGKVAISRLEKGYGKVLSKVLTKRILVCLVALVLFGGSVALVFTTGMEFMPSVDKGVIEVNVDFDTSTDFATAESTGKLIADAISTHFGDKLQYVSLTVGKQGLLATSDSGVIRIQTDTSKLNTTQTVQDIRQLIAQTKGITAKNVTVREMDGVVAEVTGGMANQSVGLLGDDMATLRKAAALVQQKLLKVDPEHIVSAVDNTPVLGTEYSFTFDRMLCLQRNVDYQTAVLMLRVGLSGYEAATVVTDGQSRTVTVQFADQTKQEIQSIVNVIVGIDDNGVVKLADVLKPAPDGKLYTANEVAAAINKQDGRYYTDINVEIYGIDSGSAGKIIGNAIKEVLADEQFAGVDYIEGGVTSYLNDAFDGLIVSLAVAFVLLYSVMACQFESLSKPFVVIMSIPFSFTGGFLALAISGITLNVVSFVGLIMLMGVIVNGAIVMIDKINMLIAEGLAPQQAVIEGCKSRLRPILMTTLTTVLALVPLALGLGRGGELMQPMGVVVLGGLLLGTTVTLVLIPCFYCLIKRIRFDKKSLPAEGAPSDGQQNGTVQDDNEQNGAQDDSNAQNDSEQDVNEQAPSTEPQSNDVDGDAAPDDTSDGDSKR